MAPIRQLNLIRKLMYTGGTNNLNTRHNKAKVHINLMNLHQVKFHNIQDFRDQELALKTYAILDIDLRKPIMAWHDHRG